MAEEQVLLRIDSALLKKLDKTADDDKRSRNSQLLVAIEKFVAERKE